MNRFKKYYIAFLLFLGYTTCYCQGKLFKHISSLEKVASLPASLKENSGLIFFRGHLWTINDSGDGPFIYSFDTLGKAVNQVITIKNGRNTDWEEITQDSNYIYIGDIGNNFGLREKLVIYRLDKKHIPDTGNATLTVDSITFSYNNMPKAKVKMLRSEYDCEAMTCLNDTLILFSKNWQKPYCWIYFLPAKPGNYILNPSKTLLIEGIVTGVSLSPDKSKLLIVGLKDYCPFIYVLNNFGISNITLKNSAYRYYDVRLAEQTEGITFKSHNEAFVSSELNKVNANNLFRIKLW